MASRAATLDDLLEELRAFRSELKDSPATSLRAQLLLARLQLQEQRVKTGRFINVPTFHPNMRMRLLRDSTLLQRRGLAKDGLDLPPDQRVEGPSEIQMGEGGAERRLSLLFVDRDTTLGEDCRVELPA